MLLDNQQPPSPPPATTAATATTATPATKTTTNHPTNKHLFLNDSSVSHVLTVQVSANHDHEKLVNHEHNYSKQELKIQKE